MVALSKNGRPDWFTPVRAFFIQVKSKREEWVMSGDTVPTAEATDRLLFRSAPDESVGQRIYMWTKNEWPPPTVLVICTGVKSPLSAVCEPVGHEEELKQLSRIGTRLEWFALFSASAMPERAKPGEHWFRGAEYVPLDAPSPE